MEEVYNAIEGAKHLILRQVLNREISVFGISFSEYQKVYASTNENIEGYLKNFDFQNKSSALSVMASGDHAFNLAYYGIRDIDTFDTNKLTEYYALGIKRSAILAFSYYEYLEFMTKIRNPEIGLEELTELIMSLYPFMDALHRTFWKTIVDYNYLSQKDHANPLNLLHMLLIINQRNVILGNKYLENEVNYNYLKLKLSKTNINFTCCDALDLNSKFNNTYDFVLLSNIPDYYARKIGSFWDYTQFREIVSKQKELLNQDGILLIAYLFNFLNNKSRDRRTHPIQESNVTINDLVSGEEIVNFPNICNQKSFYYMNDGLILERKK